jgi:hypothetical protein
LVWNVKKKSPISIPSWYEISKKDPGGGLERLYPSQHSVWFMTYSAHCFILMNSWFIPIHYFNTPLIVYNFLTSYSQTKLNNLFQIRVCQQWWHQTTITCNWPFQVNKFMVHTQGGLVLLSIYFCVYLGSIIIICNYGITKH